MSLPLVPLPEPPLTRLALVLLLVLLPVLLPVLLLALLLVLPLEETEVLQPPRRLVSPVARLRASSSVWSSSSPLSVVSSTGSSFVPRWPEVLDQAWTCTMAVRATTLSWVEELSASKLFGH